MMKLVFAAALFATSQAAVTIDSATITCGSAGAAACSPTVTNAASLQACFDGCTAAPAETFVELTASVTQVSQICSANDKKSLLSLGEAHDALNDFVGNDFVLADDLAVSAFDMSVVPTSCSASGSNSVALGLMSVAPQSCSGDLTADEVIAATSATFSAASVGKNATKTAGIAATAGGTCTGAVTAATGSVTISVKTTLADVDESTDSDGSTDEGESDGETDGASKAILPLTVAALALSAVTAF